MPKLEPDDFFGDTPISPIKEGIQEADNRSEEEKVLDRLSGTRRFYVDFSSWAIDAKDEQEATLIAGQRLANGERPEICEVMTE